MTWLDDLTFNTVIVHTVSGPSFKGLRAAVHDDCIVLREAFVIEPDSQVQLPDETVIPREQVSFMQIVKADGA